MFTDITKLSFDGLHYGLHWSNVSYHWGSNGCCAEHGFNGTVQGSQTKLRRRQTSGLSLSSRRERSDWATPTGSGSDWSRPESVSPVSWRHTSWYPKDETSVVSCSLLPLLLKTAAAYTIVSFKTSPTAVKKIGDSILANYNLHTFSEYEIKGILATRNTDCSSKQTQLVKSIH